MKQILIFNILFFVTIGFAQGKLVSKTGKITFEASVPSYEEVNAINDGVTCVLKLKNGEISSLALMKGFRFKLPLMEQHFNDNYIESDRYSKSVFKGKIENFDESKLTNLPTEYTIKGKLDLHGKSKEITIKANIKKFDKVIIIQSKFALNASDYEIIIPSIVKSKVSDIVNVTTEFTLK